jgi:PAS domain S-box-containing protein
VRNPKVRSMRRIFLSGAGVLCLVSAIVVGISFAYSARRVVLQKADARLHSAAEFLHELLGGEYHDGIVAAESVSGEQFGRMLERNDDLCRRLGLQYLWSVLVLDKDEIVFTSATRVDAKDRTSEHASFFQAHGDPRSFDGALGAPGVPVFSSFRNEWGEGRMVLVPRLDSRGRRYIVGASIQISELRMLVFRAAAHAVVTALAIFGLAYLIVNWLLRRFFGMLSGISAAADRMAEGMLDEPMPLSAVKEFSQFCRALDVMRVRLKDRMECLVWAAKEQEFGNGILSLIAERRPLPEILDCLCRFTEEMDPHIRASILLLDASGKTLVQGAAPSLPADYNALMEKGLPIGRDVGCCGTAAYTGNLAVAADIQNDPKWIPYAAFIEKTREHSLMACWSMPLLSEERTILGAFANYRDTVGGPSAENLRVLGWAAKVAAIAIEKQRVEDTLVRSSEDRRILLDNIQTQVWYLTDDHTYGAVNRAHAEFNGVEIEDMAFKNMYDIFPEDIVEVCRQGNVEVFATGKPVRSEEWVPHASGGRRLISILKSPKLRADGTVEYVVCSAEDITECKQAEDALRASEARYRFLFENMTTGFAVHEMIYDEQNHPVDYRFLQINPAFEQMTGLSAEKALGRTVKELLPATEEHWIQPFGEVALTGEPVCFENYSQALDKHFEVRAFRPAPHQFAVVFADISKRKGLEDAMQKRILALTQPLDAPETIAFDVLFDLNEVQRIQDEFSAATGVASVITDPDGNPITKPSGFSRFCNDLVRKTEKGLCNCMRSDAALGRYSPDGPIVQPCLSGGLWDAGASIEVGGRHIANWLIGQVRDSHQNDENIRDYAKEIGIDEIALLEAFHEVPVMSLNQFEKIAQSLFTLARQLSTSAYHNVQQARFIHEKEVAQVEMRRLSTAIEQSPETIVITDTDGIIQYVNPAFETITGYSREEAIGQNPRILKSGQHDALFYSNLWKTLRAGKTFQGHFINKRKNGAFYTAEATLSPVRDADGKTTGYVAIKRDITADLEREEMFRHSQKMDAVGQLTGGIAHDFNNMLQVIQGFAELLLVNLPGTSRDYQNAKEIEKAAKRAADLTRQLLAFSRKQPVDKIEINLNNTIQDSTSLLSTLMGESIRIDLELADDLRPIYVDQGQMVQVIMNLAVNARDAMPTGGRLTLATDNVILCKEDVAAQPGCSPGAFVCISVTDTGCGMSKEVQARLFEPFFTTKEVGKGTGLGLSVVYGIVKQNKGWIHLYSEEGHGTCFRVYLPAIAGGQSIPDGGSGERMDDRILPVEDDLNNQIENKEPAP